MADQRTEAAPRGRPIRRSDLRLGDWTGERRPVRVLRLHAIAARIPWTGCGQGARRTRRQPYTVGPATRVFLPWRQRWHPALSREVAQSRSDRGFLAIPRGA